MTNPPTRSDIDEVLAFELAKKEADLQAAAELGQALLEQNKELSKKTEVLSQEYSQKLENLRQEKYDLKRKLQSTEVELESRVLELQSEISDLRNQLRDQSIVARSQGRDNAEMVAELSEHNRVMSQRLQESAVNEESLNRQLQGLKEQFNLKRNSMAVHVQEIEALKAEIELLNAQKAALEVKIHSLTIENEDLAACLHEAQSEISDLEEKSVRQEAQLRRHEESELESAGNLSQTAHSDHDEFSKANNASSSRVENGLDACTSSNNFIPSDSLFAELEMAEHFESETTNSPWCGTQQVRFGSNLQQTWLQPELDLNELENEIECDDDVPVSEEEFAQEMDFYARLHRPDEDETYQLKQEILKTYKEIRAICKPDDAILDVIGGPEDHSQAILSAANLKPDILHVVLKELRGLMEDIVAKEIKLTKQIKEAEEARQASAEEAFTVKAQLDSVKEQLRYCRERLEEMSLELERQDDQIQIKKDDFSNLNKRLKQQRSDLREFICGTKRQNDGELSDSADEMTCRRGKETLVSNNNKGETIIGSNKIKKSRTEMQLSDAQIELMSLDSDLMDAIQEKIVLTQTLEMWKSQRILSGYTSYMMPTI